MPITLPNLDTLSYADLVDQARVLIPQLSPQWTDHNPTDPGIVLLELLAWLTEMVLYRVNQIPDATSLTFLQLLNGPDWQWQGDLTPVSLHAAVREAVLKLRERYRAATREDFTYLVLRQWPQTAQVRALGDTGAVARVYCLPQRNLELVDSARDAEAPAHVSVVVVPAVPADNMVPQPAEALRLALWRFLDERRLLTARLHIVGPDYIRVRIGATLYLEDGVKPEEIRRAVAGALSAFFHPVTGGTEGGGWPFGRDVHLSEVYQLLDLTPGVDFVRGIQLKAPDHPGREQPKQTDRPSCITLSEHELVTIEVTPDSFMTMERAGDTWQRTAE